MSPDRDDGSTVGRPSSQRTSPRDDEIEITVLGRGVGESIVVHFGGKWVVVDSFFEQQEDKDEEDTPAPLVYLESLGVNPATDVTSVVLTHLHRDHFLGMQDLVVSCEQACFYLPGAIGATTWEELEEIVASASAGDRRKYADVEGAARTARERDESRLQFADRGTEIVTDSGAALKCIGPTRAALTASRVPTQDSCKTTRKLPRSLNYTSTVLWLDVGGIRVLLGADLDQSRTWGWEALMKEHGCPDWLTGASFVKVPHHGSKTAHHPPLYERWCCSNPIAAATANTNGNSRLPRPREIEKLRSICSAVYQTSPSPKGDRRASGDPNERAPRPRFPTGRVTARRGRGDSAWTITLGGPAQEL